MIRLALVVVPFIALLGCRGENRAFCQNPMNAGVEGCPDAATHGGPCQTKDDCQGMPGFPVCDTTAMTPGTCVQCTAADHAACMGTTPICTSNQCTGCTQHLDCADSNVCLPDGSCAAPGDVAYVDGDNGTDNAQCSKAMPCATIGAAAGVKNTIKVTGTVEERTSLTDKTITILADPGAKLVPPSGSSGTVLNVSGTSKVAVYDLQISNAMGSGADDVAVADPAELSLTRVTLREAAGDGVDLEGGHLTCTQCLITNNGLRGVDASAGGSITITQSRISDNTNGGIRIQDDVAFQIASNVIFRNGQNDRTAGGIFINVNGNPANRLDFNSISANASSASTPAQGVSCTSGTPFKASNNIIWNNQGASQIQVNTDGQCTWAFSDIGPGPTIGTNLNISPEFVDEANGNLHLKDTSPLRGAADPAAAAADPGGLAARDIDDEARFVSGARADIGADQYYPPSN